MDTTGFDQGTDYREVVSEICGDAYGDTVTPPLLLDMSFKQGYDDSQSKRQSWIPRSFRFGTKVELAHRPLIEYLRPGEQPHHILYSDAEVTVDRGGNTTSYSAYQSLFGTTQKHFACVVTDQRILFVVPQKDHDETSQLAYQDLDQAYCDTNADRPSISINIGNHTYTAFDLRPSDEIRKTTEFVNSMTSTEIRSTPGSNRERTEEHEAPRDFDTSASEEFDEERASSKNDSQTEGREPPRDFDTSASRGFDEEHASSKTDSQTDPSSGLLDQIEPKTVLEYGGTGAKIGSKISGIGKQYGAVTGFVLGAGYGIYSCLDNEHSIAGADIDPMRTARNIKSWQRAGANLGGSKGEWIGATIGGAISVAEASSATNIADELAHVNPDSLASRFDEGADLGEGYGRAGHLVGAAGGTGLDLSVQYLRRTEEEWTDDIADVVEDDFFPMFRDQVSD